MIHYLLFRENGTIAQRGECRSHAEIPQPPGFTYEVITSSDPRRPSGPPPPTYADMRAMEYPPIGEQLDVLWKAIAAQGKPTGEVAEMLDRVNAVKSRHPKATS